MAAARKGLVAVLLVAGLVALGAMILLREHGSAAQLVSKPDKEEIGQSAKQKRDKSAENKGTKSNPASKPGVDAKSSDSQKKTEAPPVQTPPLDRKLRVVSLGWDLAVPGHLANRGDKENPSALTKRMLDVDIKSVKTVAAIKSALANGGAHKAGADIAILALPEMVAAYEDLRALKPQIFFVVGWSRGRDALFAHKKNSLLKLSRAGKVKLGGKRGSSSMLLSLYLLDIAGVNSGRIQITSKSKPPMFSAVDRGATSKIPEDARLALTSADASALIPFVAIAPQGFLKNRQAIAAWIDAWLEGAQKLEADVPDAARYVSGLKGAPETLDLVRRLGLVEFSGLRDNVRRAGLAGRDPITLSALFGLTWRLWRGVDVLTTPAPKNVPIAFDAIASLALQSPKLSNAEEPSPDFGTTALVRGIVTDMEAAANIAGVFARSSIRIGAFGKKKASSDAVTDLETRYGLSSERFATKASLSKRKSIVLEVFSAR